MRNESEHMVVTSEKLSSAVQQSTLMLAEVYPEVSAHCCFLAASLEKELCTQMFSQHLKGLNLRTPVNILAG